MVKRVTGCSLGVSVHSWGRRKHLWKLAFHIGYKTTFALTSAHYCLCAIISHLRKQAESDASTPDKQGNEKLSASVRSGAT